MIMLAGLLHLQDADVFFGQREGCGAIYVNTNEWVVISFDPIMLTVRPTCNHYAADELCFLAFTYIG